MKDDRDAGYWKSQYEAACAHADALREQTGCRRPHLFEGPIRDTDQQVARLLADLDPTQVYRVLRQYDMPDNNEVLDALSRIHEQNRTVEQR